MEIAQSLKLPCGRVLKNRLGKSAMTECLADPATNNPNQALCNVYERWSHGGCGMLITGNVQVDRNCMEAPGNVVITPKSNLQAFKDWAEAGKRSKGCLMIMQIAHAGRQSPLSVTAEPCAPSPIQLNIQGAPKFFMKPRELADAEIKDIIERFICAAALAEEAGFDGAQVHAAHGYLVNQFLSPLTNKRTDEWGGTAEKRREFLMQIVEGIRARVKPSFVVGVKLNSADFQKGGFSEEEATEVIMQLEKRGIDFVEISGGTYEKPQMMKPQRASTRAREAFFMEFAAKARQTTTVPLMVTGGFRSVAAMEEAIRSRAVDIIGMARPLTVQPDLPNEMLLGVAKAAAEYDIEFGPAAMRHITSPALNNFWHQRQIHRMANMQNPDLRVGRLWCLTGMFVLNYVFHPRRDPAHSRRIALSCILIGVGLAGVFLYFLS